MKSSLLFALAPAFVLGLLAGPAFAQDRSALTNHAWRINYALGQDIVSTFRQQAVDIDLKAFAAGMQDALAGKPAMTVEQQKAALKELQDQFIAAAEQTRKAAAAKNLEAGRTFL